MYVNAQKSTLQIQFIYLGYKELYCFFKALCIIFFIFKKKSFNFVILSFSVQICFSFTMNENLNTSCVVSMLMYCHQSPTELNEVGACDAVRKPVKE